MANRFSYLTDLICSHCGKNYDPKRIITYCQECSSPLLAQYDLQLLRTHLDQNSIKNRERGMWRWHEVLPVFDPMNIVTLGEGDTPLLHAQRLGKKFSMKSLFIKDEGISPTGSFKARGLAAAVSKAKEHNLEKLIIPTAGNAGGALAAYASAAGLCARIYMPINTPIANQIESKIFGAEVLMIEGLISDASIMVQKDMASGEWFDLSTFKEPYRTEGKKIMGYELAESFSWHLPDVIIYPTGGGTGLIGMWKAFHEMETLGWLKSAQKPRMVVVQSAGCAPVVAAFEKGADKCTFWENATTIASGLRVPKSFADRLILETIKQSNGTAIIVTDEEILLSQQEIAQSEGIFAAPEGAATWAGLKKLAESGWVSSGERVVLFITGTGLKYLDNL
jgi:threonine synthase